MRFESQTTASIWLLLWCGVVDYTLVLCVPTEWDGIEAKYDSDDDQSANYCGRRKNRIDVEWLRIKGEGRGGRWPPYCH